MVLSIQSYYRQNRFLVLSVVSEAAHGEHILLTCQYARDWKAGVRIERIIRRRGDFSLRNPKGYQWRNVWGAFSARFRPTKTGKSIFCWPNNWISDNISTYGSCLFEVFFELDQIWTWPQNRAIWHLPLMSGVLHPFELGERSTKFSTRRPLAAVLRPGANHFQAFHHLDAAGCQGGIVFSCCGLLA